MVPPKQKVEPVADVQPERIIVEGQKRFGNKESSLVKAYKIHWKGTSSKDDTWEKASDVKKHFPELITAFQKQIQESVPVAASSSLLPSSSSSASAPARGRKRSSTAEEKAETKQSQKKKEELKEQAVGTINLDSDDEEPEAEAESEAEPESEAEQEKEVSNKDKMSKDEKKAEKEKRKAEKEQKRLEKEKKKQEKEKKKQEKEKKKQEKEKKKEEKKEAKRQKIQQEEEEKAEVAAMDDSDEDEQASQKQKEVEKAQKAAKTPTKTPAKQSASSTKKSAASVASVVVVEEEEEVPPKQLEFDSPMSGGSVSSRKSFAASNAAPSLQQSLEKMSSKKRKTADVALAIASITGEGGAQLEIPASEDPSSSQGSQRKSSRLSQGAAAPSSASASAPVSPAAPSLAAPAPSLSMKLDSVVLKKVSSKKPANASTLSSVRLVNNKGEDEYSLLVVEEQEEQESSSVKYFTVKFNDENEPEEVLAGSNSIAKMTDFVSSALGPSLPLVALSRNSRFVIAVSTSQGPIPKGMKSDDSDADDSDTRQGRKKHRWLSIATKSSMKCKFSSSVSSLHGEFPAPTGITAFDSSPSDSNRFVMVTKSGYLLTVRPFGADGEGDVINQSSIKLPEFDAKTHSIITISSKDCTVLAVSSSGILYAAKLNAKNELTSVDFKNPRLLLASPSSTSTALPVASISPCLNLIVVASGRRAAFFTASAGNAISPPSTLPAFSCDITSVVAINSGLVAFGFADGSVQFVDINTRNVVGKWTPASASGSVVGLKYASPYVPKAAETPASSSAAAAAGSSEQGKLVLFASMQSGQIVAIVFNVTKPSADDD